METGSFLFIPQVCISLVIKISAFYHLRWLSYGRKTEISNYKKGVKDVIIPDESSFSSELRISGAISKRFSHPQISFLCLLLYNELIEETAGRRKLIFGMC